MPWTRTAIVLMTLAGFSLTAGNAVGAYRNVRRTLSSVSTRIAASRRYDDEERARQEQTAGRHDGPGAVAGFPTEFTELTAHAALDVVSRALRSSRNNLLWAGSGLVLSTAAAVWSVLS
ncbi:hypothetical protein [Curtobacterium sp. ISL-83]|uniref:hypothetical protein n=1 Tax=Curtobacterium sp. ISL-83 TaxID=2819145 RepID=UPI001BE6EE50|nr:hypothetical protein [Curtobacterium sp. ISL-83]MBT2501025.1 hypothetical protein [Curtobacterium sp. ISL-83]